MTRAAESPPTLRPDAIGFGDALVVGLASTSPASSLAAVIGPIVALVGVHAPRAALRPGARVFFNTPVGHGGIAAGNGKMVPAPPWGDAVRVAPLMGG